MILSLDIGRYVGLVIWTEEFGVELASELDVKNDLYKLYTNIWDILRQWEPSLILLPTPTRFRNTIINHSEKNGVIKLLAQRYKIPVKMVRDNVVKKAVLGKGNASKEEVIAHYPELEVYDSEHICDAMMFIDGYNKGCTTY